MTKNYSRKSKRITFKSFFIQHIQEKDSWGREDSIAYKELQNAVEYFKPMIGENVKTAIQNYDYAKELIENADIITDFLLEALKKGLS